MHSSFLIVNCQDMPGSLRFLGVPVNTRNMTQYSVSIFFFNGYTRLGINSTKLYFLVFPRLMFGRYHGVHITVYDSTHTVNMKNIRN
jgi:hypothetical protein